MTCPGSSKPDLPQATLFSNLTRPATRPLSLDCVADLDNNGQIDINDLASLLANFSML